ncbi:MAG: bifunctional DNA primase/polymerase [Gaiellaceae bacterium]
MSAGEPGSDLSVASWAVRYARMGLSVVPIHAPIGGRCTCGRADCPSPAKHPRVRWEPLARIPAAEHQVKAWWQRWPSANVGIATGRVSDLAVIDVDPRADGGASLGRLEARWGRLPPTPCVRTGGSGLHFWFQLAGTELASAELAAGVELKAAGAVVVAPPSIHASGRRYAWKTGMGLDDLDLAILPEWLRHRGSVEPKTSRPLDTPQRTPEERRAFAEAWTQAGVDLHTGDDYYHCPFHSDRHPSLHIDSEGCRWYCFGCRRGGGIERLRRLLGHEPRSRERTRLRGRVGVARSVTLPGDRRVEVVGESHHQDDLLQLAGGQRRYGGVELEAVAELVPEPANPADPHAVAVEIENKPIGYLRRAEAARMHRPIEKARRSSGEATCRALIRGGWDRGHGNVGSLGVIIFLPGRQP